MSAWALRLAGLVALVLVLVGIHMHGASGERARLTAQHQAELASLRADLEAKRAEAERQARVMEAHWAEQFDKVAQDAKSQVLAAQRDAVAAAAVSDGLRERAAQLARACSGRAQGATAAPGGETAQRAADLLADLFSRADAAAGELAAIADQRGAAGHGCERAADEVRGR